MARPLNPKYSIQKRQELVEQTIREKGWTENICRDLMAQTGAARRTIYRDRDEVTVKLAQEEAEGLPERRALFLNELRLARKEAQAANKFPDVMKALAMESKILGLDRVPLPTVEDDGGPVDTSLEGVLVEVQRLRKRAVAGDSYVAAEKLLEREQTLLADIRARDQAKAAAEMTHLTEADLVDAVVGNLASLPDALKQKLREALGNE